MDFKFRHNPYQDYLKQLFDSHFQNSPNEDLFKFFGYNFFHDGEILSIDITDNPCEVRMLLESLGIERKDSSGEFQSIGRTLFECTFRGVTSFIRKSPRTGSAESMCFVESQIYLTDLVHSQDGDPEHQYSLLIKAETDHEIWIQIDFDWVFVSPLEPLAFSLMASNENFRINTYPISA